MPAFSLDDADLLLQCMVDPEIDSNCVCLLSGNGPEMNTDISGPGVRISFYLQAYFLSLLSARSGSLDEITAALYTLIATNVAMTVASFILGFKSEPTMSLHDAIVVFYLLALSWASVFTSMPAYNRFVRSDNTLKMVSIVQSYLIFALGLAVLIKAPTFGSTPRCNMHAVAVVFRQFPALNAGRFVAFVVLSVTIFAYTVLAITDYYRPIKRWYRTIRRVTKEWINRHEKLKSRVVAIRTRIANACRWGKTVLFSQNRGIKVASRSAISAPSASSVTEGKTRGAAKDDPQTQSKNKDSKTRLNVHRGNKPKSYDSGVFGTLLVELLVITIVWALFVMNTELLIVRNRFAGDSAGTSNLWQFGQILPMFLVVLPLVNLIKVFNKFGLTRRYHRKRVHKHRARAETTQVFPREFRGPEGLRTPYYASPEGDSRQSSYGDDEHAPHFFFANVQPFQATELGNQPTARISLHSIHSAGSMHRDGGGGSGNNGADRGCTSVASSPLISPFVSHM